MIEFKFGVIVRSLMFVKNIYNSARNHRVILSIPSKHISQDALENKTRFLLEIENKTQNTIKITSLKFLTKSKTRGQLGIAVPSLFSIDSNSPRYLAQNTFFDSDKLNHKIDKNSTLKFHCYVPRTTDLVKIKLVYTSFGLVKKFKKREAIYFEV